MERIWKLAKAVAFILSLTTFIYVGQIISQVGQMISQKGRYQSVTSETAVVIIDTQTGTVQYFRPQDGDKVFHKIDFKEHTFN